MKCFGNAFYVIRWRKMFSLKLVFWSLIWSVKFEKKSTFNIVLLSLIEVPNLQKVIGKFVKRMAKNQCLIGRLEISISGTKTAILTSKAGIASDTAFSPMRSD